MPKVELHGIYNIRAPEPCYIVEATFHAEEKKLDLSEVTYTVKVGGRKTEQAPFEEHYLSPDGKSILGDFEYEWDHPDIWSRPVRLAFLMHFLKEGTSISTPCGDISISKIGKRPERLKRIKYVSPY